MGDVDHRVGGRSMVVGVEAVQARVGVEVVGTKPVLVRVLEVTIAPELGVVLGQEGHTLGRVRRVATEVEVVGVATAGRLECGLAQPRELC